MGPVPRRIETGTEPVRQVLALGLLWEREPVEDHVGDPFGVVDPHLEGYLCSRVQAIEVAPVDAEGAEVGGHGVGVAGEGGGSIEGVGVPVAGEIHDDHRELVRQRLRQGGERARGPREGGQQNRHRPGTGAQVVNLPAGHVDEVPGEPVGMRRGPLGHENAGGGS